MKDKALIALRWIVLLPCSLLGSWLVYIVVVWLNSVSERGLITNFDLLWNSVLEYVGQVVFGAAFVGIGAYIAPSHKNICAIVLFGLSCATSGTVCVMHLVSREWLDALKAFLTMAGAGIAMYTCTKNSDK